jgi:hypothetical protein
MVRVLFILQLLSGCVTVFAQSNNYLGATDNNEVILVTTLSKEQVYVQEELVYSIKLYYRYSFERGATFSRPEMSDAAISRLGESLEYTEEIDGVNYKVNENRFVIFPQNSGDFMIEPVQFRAYTQTRSSLENPDLLTTETRQRIELQSNAHQIRVLPVPGSFPGTNWLPSTDISISESWSRPLETMQIGDSVVRSIHVKAEDLFSSMLLSLNFTADSSMRAYPTAPEQVDIRENIGTRSEHIQNITLVATQAGQLTLPEIAIPWWNTATDSLAYARLPARDIDILTADGLQFRPKEKNSTSEEPGRGLIFGVNLNLVLFVGMLVLISFLFFAPALVILLEKTRTQILSLQHKGKNDEAAQKSNLMQLNRAYRALKQACDQKDLNQVYERFLDWGQAFFRRQNLYSLDKLDAAFANIELSALLLAMRRSLYGEAGEAEFDYGQFIALVSQFQQTYRQKRRRQIRLELPPLYPH